MGTDRLPRTTEARVPTPAESGGNMTKGVVSCQRDDGSAYTVVELTGEVDVATNSSVRASLGVAFTEAPASEAPVIVDCTKVTFLALSGITALLEAKRR